MDHSKPGLRFAGFQGGKKDPDAALLSRGNTDVLELTILGLPCTLFRDDHAARLVQEERHLQDWFGDSSVRLDRFDVRLLLDSLRQFDEEEESSEEESSEEEVEEEEHTGRPIGCTREISSSSSSICKRCLRGLSEQEIYEETQSEAERYHDLHAAMQAPQQPQGYAHAELSHQHGAPGLGGDGFAPGNSASVGRPEWQREASAEEAHPYEHREYSQPESPPQEVIYGPAFGFDYGPAEEQSMDDDEMGGNGFTAGPAAAAAAVASETLPSSSTAQAPGIVAATSQGVAAPAPAAAAGGADLQDAGAPYRPPFLVPGHLQGAVPLTERHHKILMETARFVRSNGGQVEVLLRVKQAANPAFNFLTPSDRHHAYYRWLVDTNPQVLVKDAAPGATYTGDGVRGDHSPPEQPPESAPPAAAAATEAPHRKGGEAKEAGSPIRESAPAGEPASTPDSSYGGGLRGLSRYGSQDIDEPPDEPPDETPTPSTAPVAATVGEEGPFLASLDVSHLSYFGPQPAVAEPPPPWRLLGAAEAATVAAAAAAPLIPAPVRRTSKPIATISSKPMLYGQKATPPTAPAPPAATRAASPEPCAPGEEAEAPQEQVGAPEEDATAFIGPAPRGAATAPAAEAGGGSAGAGASPESSADAAAIADAELRVIIDKLAAFVARNGPKFEATVKERERANPRFSFLLPWSPHHAHYTAKRDELTAAMAAETAAEPSQQATEQGPVAVPTDEAAADPGTDGVADSAQPPPSGGDSETQPVPEAGSERIGGDCIAAPLAAQKPAVSGIKANPRFRSPPSQPTLGDTPAATAATSIPGAASAGDAVSSEEAAAAATVETAVESGTAAANLPVAHAEAKAEAVFDGPSLDQLLQQRRERARAMLLQRQAESRRKDEAAKRSALEAHRQSLMRLRRLLGGDEEAEEALADGGSWEDDPGAAVSAQRPLHQARPGDEDLEEGEVQEEEGEVAGAADVAAAAAGPNFRERAAAGAAAAVAHRAAFLLQDDDEMTGDPERLEAGTPTAGQGDPHAEAAAFPGRAVLPPTSWGRRRAPVQPADPQLGQPVPPMPGVNPAPEQKLQPELVEQSGSPEAEAASGAGGSPHEKEEEEGQGGKRVKESRPKKVKRSHRSHKSRRRAGDEEEEEEDEDDFDAGRGSRRRSKKKRSRSTSRRDKDKGRKRGKVSRKRRKRARSTSRSSSSRSSRSRSSSRGSSPSSSSSGDHRTKSRSHRSRRGEDRKSRGHERHPDPPVPVPISVLLLDDKQGHGTVGGAVSSAPAAVPGDGEAAALDLRLRVRQMLLGLK